MTFSFSIASPYHQLSTIALPLAVRKRFAERLVNCGFDVSLPLRFRKQHLNCLVNCGFDVSSRLLFACLVDSGSSISNGRSLLGMLCQLQRQQLQLPTLSWNASLLQKRRLQLLPPSWNASSSRETTPPTFVLDVAVASVTSRLTGSSHRFRPRPAKKFTGFRLPR